MKYKPSYEMARVYWATQVDACNECGDDILIGDPVADVDHKTFHADCAQHVLDMGS